jgi:hypothetical protein
MNFFLLTTLGLLLVAIITRYSSRRVMMIQYPFLVSIVIAGWVFPQLIGIYITGTVPPDALGKTLIYIMLCLLFGVWGYSTTRKTYKMANWQYSQQKLQFVAAALMLAGTLFHVRFSALAAEATELYGGFWTGIITIYVFLASMLTVGFVLAIGAYIQKPTLMNRTMIAFGLALYLQRILIYGRREVAVELFLIGALFFWRKFGWVPSRLVLFGTVVVGMLFISAAGAYREVMIVTENYSWSGVSLSRILDIDFWGIFISNFTDPLKNQELINATLFISAADIRMEFDGGLSLWNRFVFSFIPGQIVGPAVKQSLMFPLPNLALEEFSHIPWPGTTYTGFADSFLSFWFFGAFIFFAIGSIMRSWFIAAARGSLTALMILMLISTQSLMAVTHNSYDFFLFFVNLTVFLFPALLFARKSLVRRGARQAMGQT